MIANKKVAPIIMKELNYNIEAETAASVTSGCSVFWNEQECDLDIFVGESTWELDIDEMNRFLQETLKNDRCNGNGDCMTDSKNKNHGSEIDTDWNIPDPFERSIPWGEVNLGSCAPFRTETKSMPNNNTSALLNASNFITQSQYASSTPCLETRLKSSTSFDDEHSIDSNIDSNTNTMLNANHYFRENQHESSIPSSETRLKSSSPFYGESNIDSNSILNSNASTLLSSNSYFSEDEYENTHPSLTPLNNETKTKSKFKRQRKKRGDDMIPFESICPFDVLMGQGVTLKMKNQPGNLRFRELTDANYENYDLASDKTEKTKLSEAIVSEIVRDGGRFLKPYSAGGVKGWKRLNDLEARRKVSYTFRGIRKRKEATVVSCEKT